MVQIRHYKKKIAYGSGAVLSVSGDRSRVVWEDIEGVRQKLSYRTVQREAKKYPGGDMASVIDDIN